MTDRNSRNFSFPGQLGILLGFIGVGLILSLFATVIIWLLMTGQPVVALQKKIFDPKYYNAIMAIQVANTLLMFFFIIRFFFF